MVKGGAWDIGIFGELNFALSFDMRFEDFDDTFRVVVFEAFPNSFGDEVFIKELFRWTVLCGFGAFFKFPQCYL